MSEERPMGEFFGFNWAHVDDTYVYKYHGMNSQVLYLQVPLGTQLPNTLSESCAISLLETHKRYQYPRTIYYPRGGLFV